MNREIKFRGDKNMLKNLITHLLNIFKKRKWGENS